MLDAEIQTWSKWALPARVRQAYRCAWIAGDDWRRRVRQPQETLDAMTFCQNGMIAPDATAHAATRVTLELAIISHLWPGSLDPVLRPSLRWT